MRVSVLDYGVGNLHSLTKALVAAGGTPSVVSDPAAAIEGDLLVLPGVGAFAPAAAHLAPARDTLAAAIAGGHPTLGICLGMQLLFESSEEGDGTGLGVLAGRVERLRAERLPQIGWNAVQSAHEPLVERAELRHVYYANSYACRPRDESVVAAWSTHEHDRFPAVVRRGATIGVQFHPEKSSAPGIAFLRAVLHQLAA
jgi:glutamine amidotransferase